VSRPRLCVCVCVCVCVSRRSSPIIAILSALVSRHCRWARCCWVVSVAIQNPKSNTTRVWKALDGKTGIRCTGLTRKSPARVRVCVTRALIPVLARPLFFRAGEVRSR
jgi:hypothetical protein